MTQYWQAILQKKKTFEPMNQQQKTTRLTLMYDVTDANNASKPQLFVDHIWKVAITRVTHANIYRVDRQLCCILVHNSQTKQH